MARTRPRALNRARGIVAIAVAVTCAAAAAASRAVPPAAAPPFPPYTPPPGSAPGTPLPPIGSTPPSRLERRITAESPFAPGCDAAPVTGIAFGGAEVEPYLAIDPHDPSHLIGVWQQDRWSDGAARGTGAGYSFDGGMTWGITQAALSRCTGGNPANGADFERVSDPWVAIGPDGIAYQSAITLSGVMFDARSSSAVLASRSVDGGRTWSTPATLILDHAAAFNDKDSITADPATAGLAYATWDRVEPSGHGPAYFTRTTDGGQTWEAARPIYDPQGRNQTLNNQIIVTTAGDSSVLYDFFTEFDVVQTSVSAHFAFLRSVDHGSTWSGPTRVADSRAIGTVDPQNPTHEIRDGANLASFASGPNGVLVGVWQDSRFSGGLHDGIAFSQSADGGTTWSTPIPINAAPSVAAMLPSVTVRNDGTIGVVYYDMRNDTADPGTLLVDVWLTTSTDGARWTERHVAGPFDLDAAPIAEGGLFVGDYQGLATSGGNFALLFAGTNPVATNRTDIFAAVFRSIAPPASAKTYEAPFAVTEPALTPQWRERMEASIRRTLRQRTIGPRADSTQPRSMTR